MNMQGEIQRQSDLLRSMEDNPEQSFTGNRPYISNLSLDNTSVSPRQLAQDDPRRPTIVGAPPRQTFFRPPVPSHLSVTPRRYGSIGANATSPGSLRPQAPLPPPPHPLSAVQSPPANLARRHTSADIRIQGWQAQPSPFASGQSSQWPPSPKRSMNNMNEDQRLRDSLSSYSIGGPTHSRPATPPQSNGNSEHLGNWSWSASRGDKFSGSGFGASGLFKDTSAPPTRRGSMAHILNPAETAERDEEHEEEMKEEDRKRKRMQ